MTNLKHGDVRIRALVFDGERLAQRSSDPALLAQAEIAAGEAADEQGDFPTALTKLQLAVDASRKIVDDPVPLLNVLKTMVWHYIQTKEKQKAYSALNELQAIVEEQSSPTRTVLFKSAEYNVSISFGDPVRAQRALLDSLALQRWLGVQGMLTSTLDNLSDSYLRQFDYVHAAKYAYEALSLTVVLRGADGLYFGVLVERLGDIPAVPLEDIAAISSVVVGITPVLASVVKSSGQNGQMLTLLAVEHMADILRQEDGEVPLGRKA